MKLVFNIKDEIDAQNILDLIREEALRAEDPFDKCKTGNLEHDLIVENQKRAHVDYLQELYESATLVYDTPQEDTGWILDNFDPDGEMSDEEWDLGD